MIVTCARKPLPANMLVSQCASRLGTGGINIDASRVQGEPPIQGLTMRSDRRAEPGGKRDTEGLVPRNPPNRMGRWPCNLILQHLPDCTLSGTKQVTGNKLGTVPRVSTSQSGIYQPRPAVVKHHHANADGSETVASWVCSPGCPVAELDQQSDTGCYLNTASRYFYSVQRGC